MFHFKKIFCLGLLVVAQGVLADGQPDTWAMAFNLVSWSEQLSIKSGTQSDTGWTNFFGNSLALSRQHCSSQFPRQGWLTEGSLAAGVASGGGTQSIVSYQVSSINWWGVFASARYAYHFEDPIVFSVGPYFLNRQINYPATSSGTSATSGASSGVNYGLLGEVRARLGHGWEIGQSVGALLVNSSTIWSLGIAHQF